jgi:hypothetical protein
MRRSQLLPSLGIYAASVASLWSTAMQPWAQAEMRRRQLSCERASPLALAAHSLKRRSR